eukprot:4845355-Pyramimonas_sp.AAC.1
MSGHELKGARRVMLSHKIPRHKGCSITAKFFSGDPVWRTGVAPALQRSHIVWLAVTDPVTSIYSVKGVCCQIWGAVPLIGDVCWRSSRGPIQRMQLSLFRLG